LQKGIFEDADVTHVEGNIDPMRDLEIIFEELILKDTEVVEKHLEGFERLARQTKDKKKLQELVRNLKSGIVI
jgi:ribosome-binding ATPase YchF (GTP1/OBG family)